MTEFQIFAPLGLVGLGLAWELRILVRDAVDLACFRIYKARVRRIWWAEVNPHEDIVSTTGEHPWWIAFADGQSPREAIFAGCARL